MNPWSCDASSRSLTSSFRRLFNHRRYLLVLAVAVLVAAPPAWAQDYDYGDAPDGTPARYPTLLTHSGARHLIDAAKPHLGATAPDAEADGQPNATATGDGADEDGITFITNLIAGENATVRVVVTGTGTAYLDGWIDFNADDDWADSLEHIITTNALTAGTTDITFSIPSSPAIGTTFARFRLSTATGGLSPTGDAIDGEVEDYAVTIIEADWGDAPNTFDTLNANNGPRHGITGPYMGTAPDAETDGQPGADADGDDTTGTADEDGVTFPALIRGESAAVAVTVVGGPAFVDAWIDFDVSGTFDTGEKVATHATVSTGPNTLTAFTVPSDAAVGNTYARVRISTSTSTLPHNGLADDGEVEDYLVEILGLDFGDAADPDYPTLLASNGARHADTNANPFLGTVGPDVEDDAQQSTDAEGDDTNGADDEDGVVFTSDLVPGQNATVTVTAAGAGLLDAWIDFNDDGDWNDAGEQIFNSQALVNGANVDLSFPVPAAAASGVTTAARFRYSSAGGLSPTGTAVDGEVEDLMVDIAPVADLSVTKTIDVGTAVPGRTRVTFTITVTNNGPDDADGAVVTDNFGDDLIGVIWTCSPTGGAVCGQTGGAGDIETTVDLPNGDSATFTAQAWVVADAVGVTCGSDRCLSNTAEIEVPSGTYDLTPGNDSATDSTAILEPEADLSIDKDDGLTIASPGDLGSYAIRISNPGPSSATQVTVGDTFPTAKIEGHATACSPVTADPCWNCEPAPSLDELEVQVEGQGTPTVSGLEGASSSVVSPDGAHVYATGSIDDAVVVFSRDAVTGEMTFVELQKDGVDDGSGHTVDGLDGAAAVAISPDGNHIYAVGAEDHALAVFSRNVGSGALTWVEVHTDTDGTGGGTDGLAGAHDVVVSPDGAHVYVAGPTDSSIAVFSRNAGTGALTFVECHQDDTGSIDGLDGVTGLIVSPDGANVYVAGPDDDAIAVFERDSDPNSTDFGKLTYLENHSDSPTTDGLEGANSVAVSPDGAHVYVTGGDDDAIVVFSRNSGTGALTYVEFTKDGDSGGVNGLDGAAEVTVSPDGSLVFVAAPLNSAVAAFHRISDSLDADFGKLEFADWFTSPGYSETGAAAIVDGLGESNSVTMSPDGLHLFSTGKTVGKAASLVVMKVSAGGVCPDPASGTGDLNHQIAVPACSWVEFTAWYRIRDDATGTIHNEASLTIDQPTDLVDGDSANDTDFDDTGIGLEVDIEITKVAGVLAPVPGEALDYTIIVTNHGPQNIDGSLGHITVSDIFPIYDGTTVMAGFDNPSNISWTCTNGTGGQCIDTSGTGNISAQVDLAAGGSVTLKANGIVHPWSTGDIDNTADFTLPIQYTDTNPSNDQGQDSSAVAPTADLSITKGHQPPSDDFSVDPGDIFQYGIVVHNSGPSAVRGALIQDVFPGELETIGTGLGWACSATGVGSQCSTAAGAGNITTTVDLAPGGTATFTVTTQVKGDADGAVVNTVTVDSGNASDPQTANNSDNDVITLNAQADLAITKDDGRSEAIPGQSLTYTITVTNRGGHPSKDDVFGARVEDLFPTELLDVSWTCDPTPPIPGALTFLQLNTLMGRLDGAADVAVSPDGAHVYAVGAGGNTLVAYSRVMEQGPNFGKLSSAPIDEEQQDISDPDPEQWILADLDGPRAVIVSPDGRHLYVAAATGNAVVVFARDWASASDNFGTLAWVESHVDGDGEIDGLEGATDLILSPDGEFLYVAGAADNAVAVFDRNATTGRLTFVEALTDGTDGVDGLAGVRSLAISPQGDHLYAAGANDDAVAWFSRDANTGQLTFEQAYINGAGGVDGLAGAASIILSPDGAQLYAAGPDDDSLVTFQRNSDGESPTFGALTFDVKLTASLENEGLSGVRTLALPYDVNDPQDRGEHVLAGGDPSGKLAIFRRNVTTGILSFQGVLREGQPTTPAELTVHGLEVVSAIVSSPDGAHIYTTADGDDALTVFERRQPDPSFAFVEAEFNGMDDGYGRLVSGLSAARSVAVTFDGDHVLATGFGGDALVVFHRDPELGTTPDTRGKHLAFVAAYEDGGQDSIGQTIDGLDGAAQVAVSPDSSHVYVASELDNAVAVFERNAANGEMVFVEMEKDGVDEPDDGLGNPVDGLSGAVALAVSPTGGGSSHLYVAGQYEASVAVFDRDPVTGSLSFVERKSNGVDGVQGLDGVAGIVVSPDRAHIYAVSRIDDAIVVFTRDQTDGTLTFLQVVRDGVAAEGLDQAISVAISPDGAHVFVAAVNDDALAVFSRDNDETSEYYGRLAFLQAITDGSALADKTVDGLGGARSVAVDADGLRVFVAGEHDGALSVFGRVADDTSPDFGALNLIETRYDGVDGVDGLNQIYGVAVSLADNSHVYVAGLGDNAVAAFEARSGSSCTPSGLGDIEDEVNIGWGGQVAYTVEATIAPWATGTLTNEARVYAPPRTIDPDLIDNPIPQPGDNNYAVDEDVLTPKADLVLSKTDGALSATAGEALTYTITVSNRGPSHAVGAEILDTDLDPTAPLSHFADAQWTCLAIGSGSLSLAQLLRDGDSQGSLTIDGLEGASGVALSDDGLSLYATGLLDDSVVIFDRDLSTGLLTFVDAVFNGDNLGALVEGLGGASDVAIIDDGVVESVYVTGQVDDAVAVFTRNPVDRTLLFLHAMTDSIGAEGLDQAVTVFASDDGANVYVAGANDDAIAVFQRQSNGSLVFHEIIDQAGFGLDGVSDLTVAPDPDDAGPLLSYLYATGFNSGTVAVFSRGAGGALTFVEKKGAGTSSYLGGAEAVALDPDADFIYVAGSLEGSIVVFSRSAADGTLQLEQEIVQAVDGLTGLAGVTDLVVSPDGAHLYAAGQSADAVVLFSRDQTDGTLSAVETFRNGAGQIDGLDGVAALALSPDGRQIYTAGMTDDAVAVFDRPLDSSCPPSGSGPIDEIVNVAAGGRLVFTADAIVKSNTPGSPCPEPLDPGRACVINEAMISNGTAALFSDPDTDNNSDVDANYLGLRADLKITKTDQYAEYSGLLGATAVALDPSLGRHLYLAGAAEGAIAIFDRNPGDGTLGYLGDVMDDMDGVNGLGGVSGLDLSPDAAHLYAAGPLDNAVTAFERNPDSGLLTYLETEINGIGGTEGLLGARTVAVSPGDGAHLYVAGANSNAIAIFERDIDDTGDHFGELSFVALVADGVDGVVNMTTPADLIVTDDHLYVAASGANAVVVFQRDTDPESPDFGALTYLESHVNGLDGVDGLGGAVSIALGPSGEWLFVAGLESNGVAVFGRDLVTGELAFLNSVFQGEIQGDPGSEVTVDGLAGVRAITVREIGPDVMVYTAGMADDQMTGAVARFSWDSTEQSLRFEEIVIDGDDLGGQTVDGLGGAAGLGLTDTFLYVAAADDHQLTAFEDAGGLTFVQTFTDGGGGIGPGETDVLQWVQYTITVTNLGPSQVDDAVVTDVFPPEFEDISWTCSVQLADGGDTHTSCQTPNGSGDLEETVDIAVGGAVIFSATGRLRPEMTGTLSNTATVDAPEGLIDPDLGNNTDTDDDTLLTPHADIMIHKARLGPPVPGEDITYTITVTNNGPSFALDNTVSDVLPEALVDTTWSCVALPPPGLLEPTVDGGYDSLSGASGVAITSDKTFLYAVGWDGGELMVFSRDSRTGALTLIQTLTDGVDGADGLGGAIAVTLSPDDNNVYVAGELDDAIAVFSRDTTSGELTMLEVHRDGIGVVNGLGGILNLEVSPDGRTLYAAGAADSAVAVFGRSAATGALTYSGILQQGIDGIDGLAGVADVAVSHDGAHLYAVGPLSNAVAVFERNPSTGELLFIEMVANGDVHDLGTVDGLGGASGIAVSDDDANVYVVGELNNALVVFSRLSSTGELAFVEFHQSGSNGVSGIDGPLAVTLGDDDGQVYVAGAGSNSVAAFARAADGALHFLNSFDAAGGYSGLGGVRGLVPCGGGKHIYAASRLDGEVVLLARQLGSTCAADGVGDIMDRIDLIPFGTATYTVTGRLIPGATGELVNTARVSPGPTVVDPDDTNNQSTTIDNQIEPHADLIITKDDGLLEVNAGEPLTYQIEVVNNGPSDVYGATVTDLFPIFPTEAAGLLDGSINWTCVATTSLIPFETHIDTIDGIDGLEGASWVVASPDPDGPGGETGGDHLYVTGTAADALSTFAFNSGTGAFEQVQVLHDEQEIDGVTLNGLAGASGLAFSPDGRHLFVAATTDSSVAVFERDADPDSPDYGNLVFVQAQIDGTPVHGLEGAIDVAISPDGVHVYVVSKESDSIMVYVRDPVTGMLTYSQRKTEGSDDVPLLALDGVRDLVFTPDGTHLYVAAQDADAVTVFLRDPTSGDLTFVDVVRNLDMQGSVTVNGLDFVRSLALSPGGVYLYAVSLADDAIVVFERDRDAGSAEYGHLTFLETYRDGIDGLDGLDGATAITISPDGAYLYVAGFNDDAVPVFRRDWTDGSLTLVELAQDGMPGIDALDGASGLVVTPDGGRLLVTASNDNALTVFERTAEGVCTASGTPGLLGELNETIGLTAGATATFVIQAMVDPGARGTIVNEAGVASPLPDPDPLNNLAVDGDTVITVFTDLGITKNDGLETAIAGLPLTYTIVVSNAGPALAYGITVADTLPPMLLGCTCSKSDAQPCTIDGTNTLMDVIDLDSGASLTYTIDCLLDPATAVPVTNTVTVTAENPGHDTNGANDQATDSDSVVAVSDLAVSKDNGLEEVIPGTPITYLVQIDNLGPSSLSLGRVTDQFPTQMESVSWTCTPSPGAACTPGPVAADLLDDFTIPAGGSVLYTASGLVNPAVLGTIANTAVTEVLIDDGTPGVSATDPDLSNNVATDIDTLTPVADINITKTDDVDPVTTGYPLNYTITVSNPIGPSWAHDVVVTDSLPAGVTFVGTTGCAEDPAGLPSCTIGPVANGATAQVTVSVTVDEGTLGTITNQAVAVSSSEDPNPSDNSTTEDTMVDPWANLSITKIDGEDPVVAGTELTYTITVTNPGPYDADGVTVTDSMPTGVTFISSSGCAEDPSGLPTCSLGSIVAGGSAAYTLTISVDSHTLGTITNDASATSAWFDPDLADNDTFEDTEVTAESDLAVTKDNGLPFLVPGWDITYTIVVTNDGPSDAPSADVADEIPAELLAVDWTCVPTGSAFCSDGTGNLLLDTIDLPAGEMVTYSVTCTVDPALDLTDPVTITNTVDVVVTGAGIDPDISNNSATDADPVEETDLLWGDGFESGDTSEWSETVGGAKSGTASNLAVFQNMVEMPKAERN